MLTYLEILPHGPVRRSTPWTCEDFVSSVDCPLSACTSLCLVVPEPVTSTYSYFDADLPLNPTPWTCEMIYPLDL